jgi:hypothetical protein
MFSDISQHECGMVSFLVKLQARSGRHSQWAFTPSCGLKNRWGISISVEATSQGPSGATVEAWCMNRFASRNLLSPCCTCWANISLSQCLGLVALIEAYVLSFPAFRQELPRW